MSGAILSGLRVLLVEDEYFQAMDAKRWLEQAGAAVIGPAPSADRALHLLDTEPIDAAVLDINLGGEASYATAERLKLEGVPFLFLTGYDCIGLPGEHGEVPCLSKPADENKVIETIERLLTERGMARELAN